LKRFVAFNDLLLDLDCYLFTIKIFRFVVKKENCKKKPFIDPIPHFNPFSGLESSQMVAVIAKKE